MDFLQYINPELLLIIPVLWILGKILRAASFLKNKWIPLILGFTGILLAVCWIAGETRPFTLTAFFTAVCQGILCAGAAVYGHQLIKQMKNKDDTNVENRDQTNGKEGRS